MTIALAIVCAVIAIVLIVRAVASVIPPLPLWQPPVPRPYECAACHARWTTAQHLVIHMRAHHCADFEHESIEVRK